MSLAPSDMMINLTTREFDLKNNREKRKILSEL